MQGVGRSCYSDTIEAFLNSSQAEILGKLTLAYEFQLEQSQRDAWEEEINILKRVLPGFKGSIYFEYPIPRMGQRVDVILIIGPVIFVLEFKVGAKIFHSYDIDQVWDYALDLKNFHEPSHEPFVAPILVATEAICSLVSIEATPKNDKLLSPPNNGCECKHEVRNDMALWFPPKPNG